MWLNEYVCRSVRIYVSAKYMADYETLHIWYHDVNNVSNVGGDPIIWAVQLVLF